MSPSDYDILMLTRKIDEFIKATESQTEAINDLYDEFEHTTQEQTTALETLTDTLENLSGTLDRLASTLDTIVKMFPAAGPKAN